MGTVTVPVSSPSGWDRVDQRLTSLRREYGQFEVVETETVVSRPVYTDCLQASEAESLGGARVAVRRDGDVLLARYRDQSEAWDLPGGSTDRGESHVETAKFRVYDDIGVSCRLTGIARVIEQSFTLVEGGDGVTGIWVFFEAETDDDEVSLSDDVLEATWFDPSDLPDAIDPHVRATLTDE